MPRKHSPDGYRRRARILKALAHPARLMMVDELSRGQRCVCELTRRAGSDISTVSRHLSLLRQAGLVVDEKRGRQVFYRLRAPCILSFFACVEAVMRADAGRDAGPAKLPAARRGARRPTPAVKALGRRRARLPGSDL